jgi:hypothetical protein
MEIDPLTDFIERGLTFEASFGKGGSNAIKDREDILWQLHESGSPAAGLLLADRLLGLRISFSRKDIDAVPFARTLARESFAALVALEPKTHWDWYALGCAHASGRGGTDVSHAEAAKCFLMAHETGNAYAGYEAIWEAYLGGGSVYEAIHRFRACEGRLQHFARLSQTSLALIALGPAREVGGYSHAWRIHEIAGILRVFLYHTAGSRRINIAVEAELRADQEALETMAQSPAPALVLYLIAKHSRRNPTTKPALEWLRQALDKDSPEFLALLKLQEPNDEEVRMIAEACAACGWQDSELGLIAAQWMKDRECDEDDWECNEDEC